MLVAAGPIAAFWAAVCLVLGETVDDRVLSRIPARLQTKNQYIHHDRSAFVSGVFQALTIVLAVGIYVVSVGKDTSIMAISGVVGMCIVNAAMFLPVNPKLAITKMVVYFSCPVLMAGIQTTFFGSELSPSVLSVPDTMMLISVGYMSYSFAKAGFETAKGTEALRQSQLNLTKANNSLKKHRNELQRLSMVARKTNDAVILSNTSQEIEWVNEAFTTLTGIPAKDIIGKPTSLLAQLTNAEAGISQKVAKAMHAAGDGKVEVRHRHDDGSKQWSEMQMLPVKNADDEVEFFVTIARDITAIKDHSISMRKAREAAEEAARTKADFLANMSHEIRTPLTGIIGMADLLSETEQTDEQRDFTNTIIGSSRSLLTIINDILDLSKLDAGKLQITNSTFDTRTCFKETLRLLETAAYDKGIGLDLRIADNVPEHLFADDVRLRQIATNIIGNATKFTEFGKIDVNVWMDGLDENDSMAAMTLNFAVEDTGIGIPKDKLTTIFDEFTQAESSTTRRFGGTGLGLTICRILTERMGGEITATSEYGKGSRFQVSLPVELPPADAPQLSESETAETQDYDAVDLAGLNVLVAEDNRTNRLLLSKYLGRLPITLRFANDGYEAVEATLETPPDLIFMDMSMPNMSGVEATETIRASAVQQPHIVALTANAFEAEKQACLQAGMDDFLTKPISRADLIACLQRHVGRRNTPTSAVQSALQA